MIILYFIGYKDEDNKLKPLHIMPLKTSTYVKSYDGETKWMNFLNKDGDLLKKIYHILNKVSNSIIK